MNAAIVTIGDEILIGQIVDTNSAWLSQELNAIGVSVAKIFSISDKSKEIVNTLSYIEKDKTIDIVLITGGLGPTKDDITKHTLVSYFDDELVLNTSVLNHIKSLFLKRGIPFSDLNRQQALLPSKAEILFNEVGTASGMLFTQNNTLVLSMPGVPYEMKHIVKERFLPLLRSRYELPFIYHKTYFVYGIPESEMANYLEPFEREIEGKVSLAYLPSPGRLRLRLSFKSTHEERIQEDIEKYGQELEKILEGIGCRFSEEVAIVNSIASVLRKNGLSLATAESCTGGRIASEFTSYAGASSYFKGSIVAYQKEIKEKVLGVSATTIHKYSVVSEQVAIEMAKGVKRLYQTDFSIGITGNAGPTTDDTDETVGIVYIAIVSNNEENCYRFDFGQPRERVIQNAKNKALELLEKEILKNYK